MGGTLWVCPRLSFQWCYPGTLFPVHSVYRLCLEIERCMNIQKRLYCGQKIKNRIPIIFFFNPVFLFNFAVERDVEWTGLKFSPDGKTILVSTNGSMIKLIDAFSGSCLQTFTVSILINTS